MKSEKVYIGDNYEKLTYGKLYNCKIIGNEFDWQYAFYIVQTNDGTVSLCEKTQFISLIQYRKMKLEKLNK